MIRVLVAKNEFLRRFGVATHHAVEMVVRGPRRIFAVDSAVVMNFISTSSTSGLSSVASSIDIINYLQHFGVSLRKHKRIGELPWFQC